MNSWKTVLVAAVCASTPAAVLAAEKIAPALVKRAQAHVGKSLKDPHSAKLDDLYVVQKGKASTVLCGTINAKNSFGAYEGKRLFFFVDNKESPGGAIEGEPFFVAFETFCKP